MTLRRIALLSLAVALLVAANAARAAQPQTDEARLNAYLAGTPMQGIGRILVTQGRRWNVSPYFIVAVAAKESSHGHKPCYANRLNVWGLGACGTAWTPPVFKNWTQAVNYFVRFVRARWPGAVSPWSFAGYCKGCEAEWAATVAWYMNRMGATSMISYA